jgi:hypothetical protein
MEYPYQAHILLVGELPFVVFRYQVFLGARRIDAEYRYGEYDCYMKYTHDVFF